MAQFRNVAERCHVILGLILVLSGACPVSGQSSINVVTSSATAPAGAATQIQFSLARALSLSSGELVLDLDPTVFASVTSAARISACSRSACPCSRTKSALRRPSV